MKVNIDRAIINLADGKTVKNEDKSDFKLKTVLLNAVMLPIEGEKQTGEEKYKLYELAQKISAAKKDLELTTDEISSIKKRIGNLYGVNVVGQAYNILEGKA